MQQLIELIKPYNEILILACAILGVINLALAFIVIFKKYKIEKRTEQLASKLVADVNLGDAMKTTQSGRFVIRSERGVVDGGVIIALAGVAIVALIYGQETVPKSKVVERQAIKIDESIYRCETIFEYRPVRVKPDQPVIYKKKPTKECK